MFKDNTNVGTATVTLKGIENFTGSTELQFTIAPQSISVDQIIFNNSWVYTGEEIEPTVTIKHNTVTEDSRILGVSEYNVAYNNNINVGRNTASITITLNTNNYQLVDGIDVVPSLTTYFTITEREITNVTLSAYNFVYTGQDITPEFYVYIASSTVPLDASCYTVSYRNSTNGASGDHKNVGEIIATIMGNANAGYTGSVEVKFTISQRSLTDAVISVDEIANKTFINGPITIADNELIVNYNNSDSSKWVLTREVDYLVEYANNKNAGVATITITGKGNFKDVIQTKFTIDRRAISQDMFSAFVNPSYTYKGSAIVPTLVGQYNGDALVLNSEYTAEYSNNINKGTATYVITGIGNFTGTLEGEFEITAQVVDGEDITVNGLTEQVYTGSPITLSQAGVPTFTVSYLDSQGTTKLLTFGTDFTVQYENNQNAGDADIILNFTGNYAGTHTVHFTINPYNIENLPSSAIAEIPEKEYTGAAITPDTTVMFNGITLKLGTDYNITYQNHINASTDDNVAVATIQGINNFTGSVVRYFTITTKALNSSMLDLSSVVDKTYNGSYAIQNLVIRDGSKTLVLNRDYVVTYQYNINAAKSTDANAPTYIVTGMGNYSGGFSGVFNILQKNINDSDIIINPIPTQAYTGSIIKPVPSIRHLGETTLLLQENLDFELTYPNNSPVVGEHQVIITGLRNYTGTYETSFFISNLAISNVTLDQTTFIYNGQEQVPNLTVYANDKILKQGTDFTVTYLMNNEVIVSPVNAGTITIIVTAVEGGNFSGEIRVRYEISARSLDDENFTYQIAESGKDYTGSTIYLADEDVAIFYGDIELVFNQDFTLSYRANPISVGEYEVTVNGIGNYTGSINKTFNINAISIDEIVLVEDSVVYDGNGHLPQFSVYANGLLVEDYNVVYTRDGVTTADFINFGTIAVNIEGQGNFTGTLSKNFVIERMNVDNLSEDSFDYTTVWSYTGKQITPDVNIIYNGNNLALYNDFEIIYGENIKVGVNSGTITINGIGNFSGTTILTFEITKATLAASTISLVKDANPTYTGYQVMPQIVVVYNGVEVDSSEYEIVYGDNINAGTNAGSLTIRANDNSNFSGSKVFNFTIAPKAISSQDINIAKIDDQIYTSKQISVQPVINITIVVENVTYTGSQLTPNVTVTLVGSDYTYTLIRGQDFEVSYGENINVATGGTLTVYALENGNFKDSKGASFAISPKAIDTSGISVEALPTYTYNSLPIVPEVVITYTVGNNEPIVLIQDVDFVLSYNTTDGTAPSSVGTYQVTITGQGNYVGTRPVTMVIGASAITGLTLSQTEFEFNYVAQTPELTVTSSDTMETPTYSVTYQRWVADDSEEGGHFEATADLINSGIIQVVVSGTGNFSGQLTKTYNITQKSLSDNDIVVKYYTETGGNRNYVTYLNASSQNTEVKAEVRRYFDSQMNINGILSDENGYYIIINETLSGENAFTALFTRDGTNANTNWSEVGTINVILTATDNGNYVGVKEETFNILPTPIDSINTSLSIAFIDQDQEGGVYYYTGSEIIPNVQIRDGEVELIENEHYTVEYASNTERGVARLTITAIEGSGYTGAKSWDFMIIARPLSHNTITSSVAETQTFTGFELTPEINLLFGDYVLDENDVSYVYGNNINASDSAYIEFTGKGNFSGTKRVTFTINKKVLTGADDVVFDPISSQTYTGKEIKPEFTVRYGEYVLTESIDFNVQYSENIEKGDATIRIDGINNFEGYTSTTFEIAEQPLSRIELAENNVVFTGLSMQSHITPVVYDAENNVVSQTISGTQQYLLSYERAAYGTSNFYPVSSDETWIGAGHIRITATATNDGNYGGSPVSVIFTIAPRSITDSGITISGFSSAVDYTGSRIEQNISFVYDTYTLQSSDFALTYSNNQYVGTATIVVQGQGNFTGSRTLNFEINRLNFATYPEKLNISGFVDEIAYTGSEITQTTLSLYHKLTDYNSLSLINGRDYELEYSNNLNAGTAIMNINFMGNYVGTVSKEFTISECSLTNYNISVTLPSESFTYTGSDIEPEVEVKLGNVVLYEGLDYTVEYSNNINAARTTAENAPTITITGKGNFKDVITRKFAINARLLSDVTVSGVQNKVFNGGKIEQDLTLSFGDSENRITLEKDVDYTVTYTNNINVGTAYAIINAKSSNYADPIEPLTITFTITPFELTQESVITGDVVVSITNPTYTGSAITLDEEQLVVSIKNGEQMVEVARSDANYILAYTNNVNAGDATVTVIGNGNLTGSIDCQFTILQKSLSSGIVLPQGVELVYTGTNVELDFNTYMVTYNNIPLVKDVDFTVEYTDNINVNSVIATLTGKGNYFETCQITFNIVPKNLASNNEIANDVTVYVPAILDKGGAAENAPEPIITYGENRLVFGEDFTVTYRDNEGITNDAVAIISVKNGGNYYINGSYTGTLEVKFSITPLRVNSVLFDNGTSVSKTVVFTGQAFDVESTFNVYAEIGTPLNSETDYDVVYERFINGVWTVTTDFTNVGDIRITATGKGEYANNGDSSASAIFNITAKDIADIDVTNNLAETYAYTGVPIEPEIILYINGTEIDNTDFANYSVAFTNNTAAGEASVTLVGKNNFYGTVTYTFNIGSLTLSSEEFKALFTGFVSEMVYTGEEIDLPIVGNYSGYVLQLGKDYQIIYSGDNINVTGEAITATVQGMGGFADCGSFETTVTITKHQVSYDNLIVDGIENKEYTGGLIKQTFVATVDGREVLEGIDFDVTYESNTNRGTATMNFVFKNNYVNEEEIIIRFSITPKALTTDMIENIKAQAYTGTSVTPRPNIIYNGMMLVENIDFMYSWSNNTEITEIAVVTITAIEGGNYTGSASKNFAITNNSISDASDFEVSNVEDSYEFTGLAITPEPVLTYKETSVTLEKDVDYTINYVNNVNVGFAVIQVTFKGSYEGYAEIRFEITKTDLGLNDDVIIQNIEDQVYTGHAINVVPVVTINGVALNVGVDFIVEYTSNINVGEATLTIIATENGNFTGFKDAKFNIVQADIANMAISVISADGVFTYTGQEIQPQVSILNGDVSLIYGSHYTLSYRNNINKATADSENAPTIIITAISGGNYKGSAEVTFTIASKLLDSSMVSGITNYEFTGSEIQPSPVVYDSSINYILSVDKDYSLSYSNNINVGTGTIIITGIGNFEGEVSVEFEITARYVGYGGEISDRIIVDDIPAVTYTGSPIIPEFVPQYKVNDGNIINLEFGKDYTLTYENNTNAGQARITLTGINNYTGFAYYYFTINKYSLLGDDIVINEIGDQYYNYGNQITPEIIITFKGELLTLGEDYEVIYGENYAVGSNTGSINIVAYSTSNFDGNIDITFDILALQLNEFSLSLSEATFNNANYNITYSVFSDGRELTEDQDYYVRVTRNNIETSDFRSAGTIVFTAIGFGNYAGELTQTFVIYPKVISDADITKNAFVDRVYNDGIALTQSVALMWSGVMNLVNERDFTVSYENNINAGVAIVTITGVGDFAGEIRDTFIIRQKESVITGAPYYDGELYEGDPTSEIRLSVPAGSTRGYVRLLDEVLRIGTQEYFYEFIPTDENGNQNYNYTVLSGKTMLTVISVELVGAELGESDYQSEYTAYDYFNKEDVEIYLVYNNGDRILTDNWELKDNIRLVYGVTEVVALAEGYEIIIPVTVNAKEITIEFSNYENLFESRDPQYINYTITGDMDFDPASNYITLVYQNLTTGRISDHILEGGTYRVYAEIEDGLNYVFSGVTEIEFMVTSKQISSPEGVTIYDDYGVDVESTLVVNKIVDEEALLEIVGEAKVIPEVAFNIKIVTKDGSEIIEIGHNVYVRLTVADPTKTDYAVYRINEDGSLSALASQLNSDANYIEFVTDTLGDFLLGSRIAGGGEAFPWWWIVIGVGAVAIVAVVCVVVLRKRKGVRLKHKPTNDANNPESVMNNTQGGAQNTVANNMQGAGAQTMNSNQNNVAMNNQNVQNNANTQSTQAVKPKPARTKTSNKTNNNTPKA